MHEASTAAAGVESARTAHRSLFGVLADAIFAKPDTGAAASGLQVKTVRRGYVRVYRDPRLDSRIQCEPCRGRGYVVEGGPPCAICLGDGWFGGAVDQVDES
jgi:hypothetical protein